MGAAASTPRRIKSTGAVDKYSSPPSSLRLTAKNISQHDLTEGNISSAFQRMKESGYNDEQIYQNLRETYGSLRVKKQMKITDHTIRGLAIHKLSNTLETNRILYPIPKPSPPPNTASTPNIFPLNNISSIGEGNESTSTVNNTPRPKTPRKKPNLKIIISQDPEDEEVIVNPQESVAQKTPRDRARISPSGALRVGELAIYENGIQTAGFFEERQTIGFLTSGLSDFVIVGSLGRGASGSVLEALHIPTLTLVALKVLPISDAENLHQIASELDVLYQNLAELKLIDERLEDPDPTITFPTEGGLTVKSACPQLLAMYDGTSFELLSLILSLRSLS